MSLKSDYNVYFSLSSSLFGSKSFLRLVLLLTRLFSSSSDVGVKNLANSLTRCTVPLSIFADPERILRRLYVFAEEPCKSTTTTSEPCSPVFKEAQPRPSLSLNLKISHKQLESVSICIWTVIIYYCNKKHPTGL